MINWVSTHKKTMGIDKEFVIDDKVKSSNIEVINEFSTNIKIGATDISSFGLHIFLWHILKLSPTELQPEMMGSEWICEDADENRVIYTNKILHEIIEDINKSDRIRKSGKEKLIFVNPKDIIFVAHEYEVLMKNIIESKIKEGKIKLPVRPSIIRLNILPYIERLYNLITFTEMCMSVNCGYKVIYNNIYDQKLLEAIS